MRLLIFSFILGIISLVHPISAQPNGEPFILPESTLEAAERKLQNETDPERRFQILLKWIRIKEEVEKGLLARGVKPESDEFLRSKREIIEVVEKHLFEFAQTPDIDLMPLFRELAFRYGELRNFQKAIEYFQRITSRTPDDELALGDAFFNLEKTDRALEAYARATEEPRLRSSAAYKRAWAFMRTNDFPNALKEFDLCLTDPFEGNVTLKKEAFQDRIRPYLETFPSELFDREQNDALRRLARQVYPSNSDEERELYVTALRNLVEGFNAKSQVVRAQNVFFFLSQEINDSTEILILSAPTWIKVYRGRLDHNSVVKILNSLPERAISLDKSAPLRAELYNTAVFYESYKEDESEREDAWNLLRVNYKKYFQLYPLDKDADPLRVNYSRILLNDGDARECLNTLENRGGKDEAVEEIASSLEGKCELKFLDQLYSEKQDQFFFDRLSYALHEQKIYNRPDLGVSPEVAFESLSRMLIGALETHSGNQTLREALSRLLKTFPYSKQQSLYEELQTVSAELRFKDLLALDLKPEDKSKGFYEIFLEAREGTDVAQKSLTNAILMGRDQETLSFCPQYKDLYPAEFKPESAVFDKCIQLAEHFLNLDEEYSFWKFNEKNLSTSQQLRIGLLEMALNKKPGRSRVENLKTDEARKAIELWDGASSQKTPLDARWTRLQSEAQAFFNRLKPISLNEIAKEVPKKIKSLDELDAKIVEYINSGPEALWSSKSLALRSKTLGLFYEWMSQLPKPTDLSEEDLALYNQRTQEILEPWKAKAEESLKTCSEVAFTLTPLFKEEDEKFCPEQTESREYQKRMSAWRSAIPRNRRVSQMIRIILTKASQSEELDRSKYYLLRALDLSDNERERANTFLVLARKTDRPIFWETAYELDGSLIEAVQWRKERAAGNPFFERLYEAQIRLLRSQGQR